MLTIVSLAVVTSATVLNLIRPTAAVAQEAGAAKARSVDEVQKDLNAAGQALAEVMPGMAALLDEAKRAEVAPKALPAMRRMTRLVAEYAEAAPEFRGQIGRAQMELWTMMALLGDAGADDEIRKRTVSKDEVEAADAKSWSVVVRWVRARKDAAAQERLAGELGSLARANPRNPSVAQAASLMADAAATPALAEQVERVVTDDLRHPAAEEVARAMAGRRKLRALEGQPLVIEGATVGGPPFSTAAWKGKVVLVDFWATWCGPCLAEAPALKKLYADHRAAGLEVVGVSCDRDPDHLKAYLAKNPDMPWPQLFEPGKGWHPLAERFGVHAIPTMFLIDRKGVVRSVTARENYKELVPKLLGEKE